MARYTGPACRICRRHGEKLMLKGARCFTPKCSAVKRHVPPGQHGTSRQRKTSEYSLQLKEKQKARHIYGVLERQFRRHFADAERRPGLSGENLLQILERDTQWSRDQRTLVPGQGRRRYRLGRGKHQDCAVSRGGAGDREQGHPQLAEPGPRQYDRQGAVASVSRGD